MTTADHLPCPRCPTQDACGTVGRCLDREAAPAATEWACRECEDWSTCQRKGKCFSLARRYVAMQEASLAARKAGMRLAPVEDAAPHPRAAVLREAEQAVMRDRAATHGEAEDTFGHIARVWSARLGVTVTPAQVCILMADLKGARAWGNPKHRDNWTDGAGYFACGWGLVAETAREALSGPVSGQPGLSRTSAAPAPQAPSAGNPWSQP